MTYVSKNKNIFFLHLCIFCLTLCMLSILQKRPHSKQKKWQNCEDFEELVIHNKIMDVLRKKLKLTENSNNGGSGNEKKESVLNKNKLLSTWYNMKYGKAMFSLESNTLISNCQSPVWLLGQCYHRKMRKRIHYDEQVRNFLESWFYIDKENNLSLSAILRNT